MNYFNLLKNEWQSLSKKVLSQPWANRIVSGKVTRAEYCSLLREIYFHTRENPQIQAAVTPYFRNNARTVVKGFLKHAIAETGHDQLALQDLTTLGVETADFEKQRPLPATTALLAFPFYTIQYESPIRYLGYLFFLEFLPTQAGPQFMRGLSDAGIPIEAMTFLHDHSTIDMGHNKLMEKYVEVLITSEVDLELVVDALKVTADLYVKMINDSFERGLASEGKTVHEAL